MQSYCFVCVSGACSLLRALLLLVLVLVLVLLLLLCYCYCCCWWCVLVV